MRLLLIRDFCEIRRVKNLDEDELDGKENKQQETKEKKGNESQGFFWKIHSI